MKATFNPAISKADTVGKNRKENAFLYSVILLGPPEKSSSKWNPVAHPVAELRVYGTHSVNYACLWVHAKGRYFSGGGKAKGYGYHRPSQAAEKAIEAAGIELSEAIGGVGDSAIEEALIAIGRALGFKKLQVLKAHG